MFLWCRNIYIESGNLGTFLDGFMWLPWLTGLAGPYMWSTLT